MSSWLELFEEWLELSQELARLGRLFGEVWLWRHCRADVARRNELQEILWGNHEVPEV